MSIRRYIPEDSSLNLPKTPRQVRRITDYCRWLGIRETLENTPSNRREANDLIYYLRAQLRAANAAKKAKRRQQLK